jgi:hypothetical protein
VDVAPCPGGWVGANWKRWRSTSDYRRELAGEDARRFVRLGVPPAGRESPVRTDRAPEARARASGPNVRD